VRTSADARKSQRQENEAKRKLDQERMRGEAEAKKMLVQREEARIR